MSKILKCDTFCTDVSGHRLDKLLQPIGMDVFLEDYFDKQPLFVSGDADRFQGLGDVNKLRSLIESGSPWQFRRLPEMYLDGGFIPHEDLVRTYTDMDNRQAVSPILQRIKKLLKAGATVNCFGQEAHFPELQALRKDVAIALSAEVEASFFYSQRDHRGLAPHYDCVEIFVLQVSGSKRWYVSNQRVTNPVVGYGKATTYDHTAGHATIELVPGDMLYMPRGTFHHACAITDESLHVTLAVKLPMYIDLLDALMSVAPKLDPIRQYLPVNDPVRWEEAFPGLLERLSYAVESEGFCKKIRGKLIARSAFLHDSTIYSHTEGKHD